MKKTKRLKDEREDARLPPPTTPHANQQVRGGRGFHHTNHTPEEKKPTHKGKENKKDKSQRQEVVLYHPK